MADIEGTVHSIFICDRKGQPMEPVDWVMAVVGQGLVRGEFHDRYARRKGAWSGVGTPDEHREVSLIAHEAIARANAQTGVEWGSLTRRNIVLKGLSDLNPFVGKTIQVGQATLSVATLCDPCDRPSNLSKIPGFQAAFAGQGGVRAQVLESGVIRAKDRVLVLEDELVVSA